LTTDLEPATPRALDHPVGLRVIEDLRRSRLTTFFRLALAIPHYAWLTLWTIAVLLASIVAGFIVLIRGRLPDGLHRFFTAYIRYWVYVNAYLCLAANRFPGFTGAPGYDIDVEFAPPAMQNRWKTFFRIVLVIPALMVASALTGSGGSSGGVLVVCAVLIWFVAMVRARAPEGLSRLEWYCLHYGAQTAAYGLFVTDRYPTSDPERLGVPWPPADHPIRLAHEADDGRRNRLTVFFRLLLGIPHYVWLYFWGYVALVAALVNWLVTLIAGRSPDFLHRFLGAYVRQLTQYYAYMSLLANPYPGFIGKPGSYPVDLEIDPPARQNRWKTLFRIVLAIPALLVLAGLAFAMALVAVFGWFASLFTGRMPDGLRKLGLYCLRYLAQLDAYLFLLTDSYPYAGPPADAMRGPVAPPAAIPPAHTEGFSADDPRSGWVSSPFGKETSD
jgi:hypothetical protein